MYDETYPWRYATSTDVNGHTTITRGRPYRLIDSDSWAFYWEGDTVAFYDEGYRGIRALDPADEDTLRAIEAHQHEQRDDTGAEGALKKVAQRITGNLDADFIRVGLDRGIDFYALSWSGQNSEWRDEIECVYNNEVYRMETQEYHLIGVGPDGEAWGWLDSDNFCEEWYGSDNAEQAQAKAYPLTEFPAELLIDSTN